MTLLRSETSSAKEKKALFAGEIAGWDSWGRIFQDIGLFKSLIQEICRIHSLPFSEPEHLTPGTNAVFAVGNMVFKIYAPAEAGFDQSADCDTEIFAMQRSRKAGVSVPEVIATGILHDRYVFRYLVQSRCLGKAFREIWPMPDHTETVPAAVSGTVPAAADSVGYSPDPAKTAFARSLRRLLTPLNTSCGSFNNIDVILDPERGKRWDPFPEDFREDRLRIIAGLCETVWKPESFVFVHGDLNEDNILIDGNRISLLDFGDACLAPIEYEYALAATELFRLDKAFLQGFFPEYYDRAAARLLDELADLITRGILIHDFGGDVLRQRFGLCESLHSTEMLRDFIRSRL